MSKIVIGIACHKPFEMPENELYLPISVGSALRDAPIPGAQPDDEGDNISEKNPQYCELTAQYWLWKNVDADYYGLCHYRRFLSFAPTRFDNFTPDNRKQVLVPEINGASKEKYHLEDVAGMRAIIEASDIVAPDEQDLSKVYTPHGHKRSVYKHFAAHDRDLINVEDLDKMIAIVHEKYPRYAADMDEYLSGPAFRGFNCFVMRRDLFFELCEYEFDVLSELEKSIDFATYDVMRARVYGFMAEIISSSFIYHVAKEGRAKVTDVQMLYFANTDPVEELVPWEGARVVVGNTLNVQPSMLAVTLRSFVESINPSLRYDLIIVFDKTLTPFYREKFREFFASVDNVRLSFLDWDTKARALEDAASVAPGTLGCSVPCALPWLLPHYDRVVAFEWNVLFARGWSGLFSLDLDGSVVAAALDVEWVGGCNGVYSDIREFASGFLGLQDPLSCCSASVCVEDAAAIRRAVEFSDVMRVLASFERVLESSESFNVIFEGSIKHLDMEYCAMMSTDREFSLHVGDLPTKVADEYRVACQDPAIIVYAVDDPFWGEADHVLKFWEIARRSPFYESILMLAVSAHVDAGKQGRGAVSMKRRLFNGIAPEGSQRRALVRKLIPWNSPVAKKLRQVVQRS